MHPGKERRLDHSTQKLKSCISKKKISNEEESPFEVDPGMVAIIYSNQDKLMIISENS